MQATRRCWSVAGTGLVVLALGAVAAQPIAFLGAAGLGAYLIGHAAAFTVAASQVDETLDISLTPSRRRAEVGTPVECAVAAIATTPLPCSVTLDVDLPTPLNDVTGTPTIHFDAGETAGETVLQLEPAVAGQTTLGPITLEFEHDTGLFTETVTTETAVDLTVEPPSSGRVHVGQGSSEIAAAYGEHTSDRRGAGLTPAELREYAPGDSADSIDWKATARLSTPYVREFEAETDRRTVLLVDARSRLAGDNSGQAPFSVIRSVALAVAGNAEALGDPLGMYAIGDEGLVHRTSPSGAPRAYREIREALHRLQPTPPETAGRDELTDRLPPATARRWADQLDGSDQFAKSLRPFVETSDPYVQRIAADPLFETVRSELTRLRGENWTVLVTDDTDRPRLRESVKLASRSGNHVLAFITPQSLYDDGQTPQPQRREAFVDFEEFRRKLDRLPRVSAFEIGPATQVKAVLAQASRREASR